MPAKSYARGLIFWIDDAFENKEFPSESWENMFGSHTNRVFRLFDLHLEIATSYEEALDCIENFDSYREAGTFIFCIVDLIIPARSGERAEMMYGVSLAKELRKRGITFGFLSSNTGGAKILDKERLSGVPYHFKDDVKEEENAWRLPNSLVLNLLSELRRHISWVCLEEVVALMHDDSDIKLTFDNNYEVFKYFPFFGSYREYVERCEYRTFMDISPAIAVRAPRKHCDELIQQALSIMLFQNIIQKPGMVKVLYGHAHDKKYLHRLTRSVIREDHDSISIVRVTPEFTSLAQVEGIVDSIRLSAGKFVFILPNDESIDQYIEYLRSERIHTQEELPHLLIGDQSQREELILHSCVLTFNLWSQRKVSGEPVRLEKGSLTHPELLINPIHWYALLETTKIPEALSDPYEIIKELFNVLNTMGLRQCRAVIRALEKSHPVPYKYLLKVGHQTLVDSEFKEELGVWIEGTLDMWLKTSWQHPYGILDVDSQKNQNIETSSTDDFKIQEEWQNSCFEILNGVLTDYHRYRKEDGQQSERKVILNRVTNFIESFGGMEFLNMDLESINWDEFALLRWPHRQYPMPSAIVRRLREAGQYLWIQPEGLDIAAALPTGRIRYRLLGSIVDSYWNTLTWLNSIADYLPQGWNNSVQYLSQILIENRLSGAWEDEPDKIWTSLKCLMRNGCPIMLITSQMLKEIPIHGNKDSIKDILKSAQGYGKLLGKIRGSRHIQIGNNFKISNIPTFLITDLEKLHQSEKYFKIFSDELIDSGPDTIHGIESAVETMFQMLSASFKDADHSNNSKLIADSSRAITKLFIDEELRLLKGNDWFDLDKDNFSSDFFDNGDIPSLYGTKADYVWLAFDSVLRLENITQPYRFFDGYHFLAALNDLRVSFKDTDHPKVPLAVIETIMDLFLAGIEGLIAQLSWLTEIYGESKLAERIKSPRVKFVPGKDFEIPANEDIGFIYNIKATENNWEMFTLGLIGKSTVNKLCYEDGSVVREYKGENSTTGK